MGVSPSGRGWNEFSRGAVPGACFSMWNSGTASLPTLTPGLWPVVVRGSEGGTRLRNSPWLARDSALRVADIVDFDYSLYELDDVKQ